MEYHFSATTSRLSGTTGRAMLKCWNGQESTRSIRTSVPTVYTDLVTFLGCQTPGCQDIFLIGSLLMEKDHVGDLERHGGTVF